MTSNCWVEISSIVSQPGAVGGNTLINPWGPATAYPKDSLVNYNGQVWLNPSAVPGGKEAPGTYGTQWVRVGSQTLYITDNDPPVSAAATQATGYGLSLHTYPDPTKRPPQPGDIVISTNTGDVFYLS